MGILLGFYTFRYNDGGLFSIIVMGAAIIAFPWTLIVIPSILGKTEDFFMWASHKVWLSEKSKNNI